MAKKRQTFIEYLEMLETEYRKFSYPHLVAMCSEIAEKELSVYADQLQSKPFSKYYPTLKAAMDMLKRAAINIDSISEEELTKHQNAVNETCRKMNRYHKDHHWLMGVLVAISSTISYYKTQDPLYMIGVYTHTMHVEYAKENKPEQHIYYPLLEGKYKVQIDLLWKLKQYLKV